MINHIAIRVDASHQIGTGHFMRCLTLADALSQRGAQIRFISRHLPEYLQDMLRDKGYEFRMLESAVVCDTLEEALTGCALAIGMSARKRQLSHELISAREASIRAASIASQEQNVALVFGTEMSGLSNRELDLCQLLAMIPTNPDFSSLNVAAAVQVMCYELRMSEGANVVNNSTSKLPLATSDEVEGFYQHLEETLIKVGFLNPKEPKKLMQRVRRIYARASLEKEEVNILRGILKLTQNPRSFSEKE